MTRVLEVCVDNYESALAAIEGGASRLELCLCLKDGGLTPTLGLLKQIKQACPPGFPVYCMLRCRPGNFIYSEEEINIMVADAKILKLNGADGFVFGALNEDCNIDMRKCREIIKTCYPLPVTFHRAFDLVKRPLIELESIIDLGFQRLLTSGAKQTALEGSQLIRQLIKRAHNRLVVIPGCGINKDNVKEILEETEAREFHGSFSAPKKTEEENPQSIIILGDILLTNAQQVSEVVQILKS